MTDALQQDQSARQLALDATQSFIVQAPAGSGKTELLVQRLLTVLATAEHPSEVLAITFTNKAAGEMRERLLSALQSAMLPEAEKTTPLEQARRDLALRVVERDRTRGWRLLEDLSAVLIDTFDAFCARLVARAPLGQIAAAGALAGITETITPLYREAARDALFDADIEHASSALLTLAVNRVDDVIDLIANLLGRRSQWLGEAVDTSDEAIARLTDHLQRDVQHEVDEIDGRFGSAHDGDIERLLRYTSQSFRLQQKNDFAAERDEAAISWASSFSKRSVATWRTVASMLLTGTGELRKPGGVNKTAGFPKGDDKDFAALGKHERDEAKACMQALLDDLSNEPAFVRALAKARHLPTIAAITEHASTLKATLVVLRQAAAHLNILLRERGVTDFGGVANAALQVLQDSRDDVMTGLDAQLRHVLVDEVQDTNPAQFALLTALTIDWSTGDGRTLFLVGDPMQSIYGFRDADVGLFKLAQASGVGNVQLIPLTLLANYRSQPVVVDWVNTELSRIFGQRGVWERVAVQFEPAVATRIAITGAAVQRLAFADVDDEARSIAQQVMHVQQQSPDATIAILVRNRSHADAIITNFARECIPFVAREFANWRQRETIRDLLSLTYAIAQPSDRLALFSVLRSPWIGVTLATLAVFAGWLDGEGRDRLPWHSLASESSWQDSLPNDERGRLALAHEAFCVAEARAWMSPLAERVQAAWQQLGGYASCVNQDAHEDADAFFAWLHVHAVGGMLPPRHVIEDLLDAQKRSFSSAGDSTNAVEILTIHKAKGLEWDHVFLPGIDRKQRGDTRELAQWRFTSDASDVAGQPQRRSVLIAARDTRKRLEGSVYDYVSQHTAAARAAEVKRLLYVAATRAKFTLTLTRCNAAAAPATDSFSALLGDAADDRFERPEPPVDKRLRLDKSLSRWLRPSAAEDAEPRAPLSMPAYRAAAGDADLAIPQSQLNARAEGIVGHLLFEGLAAVSSVSAPAFSPVESAVVRLLRNEGADTQAAARIAHRLCDWFRHAAGRANVQFLFAPTHLAAANELSLVADNRDVLRADRTFVTKEGERWLVDFKFSEPPEQLIDNEEATARWLAAEAGRYEPQMKRYATALKRMDDSSGLVRPLRVALYFPWLDVLHEVG
jgi:ATP-dependent helicase/nuclease subunit A